MNYKASDVAAYILAYFQSKDAKITNLKLQKLLYYSQAWHLTITGEPMFVDRIEAWVNGPVVPNVFQIYKPFRWSDIGTFQPQHDLDENTGEFISEVLKEYGNFSPWDLVRLTHNEDPWKITRGDLPPDASCNREITHELMKKFYSEQ